MNKKTINSKINTDLNLQMPTWCPGCGDFGIWSAFKLAAQENSWNNINTVLVAGIGCHGHIINFTKITSFEGLHGRDLPVASGIKMANHSLNVFVFTGDGDCLAEGGNHFLHSCRRNHDLTVILHDNAIYGLTTGQTSPRSPHGFKSKSTPDGNLEEPLNPVTLAISAGATFVARAYSGDIEYLSELISKANAHKGFAFIDVLQPCVTFNKLYTHYFYQSNTYKLEDTDDYLPTNKEYSFRKSLEWGEKSIPLGIFYQSERPTYESQIKVIEKSTLVSMKKSVPNLNELMLKFS